MSSSLELPASIRRIKGSNAQANSLSDRLVIVNVQSIAGKFFDGILKSLSSIRSFEASVEEVEVLLDLLCSEMWDGARYIWSSWTRSLAALRAAGFRADYSPLVGFLHIVPRADVQGLRMFGGCREVWLVDVENEWVSGGRDSTVGALCTSAQAT